MLSSEEPLRDIGLLYDIVLLQAYANGLFDYARNEEQSIANERPTQDDMVTALRNTFGIHTIGRNEGLISQLHERIEKRH